MYSVFFLFPLKVINLICDLDFRSELGLTTEEEEESPWDSEV